ncbi:DUF1476 domain-containing protein [Inquilinus sp. OTU3971]|uniref:DUF1476 domain-containing protein n=1 Tax=Inquilinus sp. OTU3971 TaxID=3043855 RepID=UPI00313CD539
MTFLDSREKAIEAAFQHDQEMAFRIRTRRDRLLGFWAAELIGLTGLAADSYAGELVAAGVERTHWDITRKVRKDLAARGIRLSAHRLNRKMNSLMQLAQRQILGESDKTLQG